jgi:hypothetical protein
MQIYSSKPARLLTSLSSIGLLSILALTSACVSKPPEDIPLQMERTQTTISQAEKAGANQSALPELQVAKDKLAGAQQALTAKDYDKARDIAKQGQVDAEYALAKAQAAEAQRAAKEAAEANSTLRQETKHSADAADGS